MKNEPNLNQENTSSPKTLDFIPSTKICSYCLQLFNESDEKISGKGKPAEVCSGCRSAFYISSHKKRYLWDKQLKLFLNYKSNECFKDSPDILAAYSGGTDSTLALYIAKEELKLDVVALRFSISWERAGVDEQAKEFCLRYRIPLITINVDLKSIFSKCYRRTQKLSDKTIVDYPWCELCSMGNKSVVRNGTKYVADLLKINRVITGNNIASFEKSVPVIKKPQSETEQFQKKYSKWLYPTCILGFFSDYISINLPLAYGYNKEKKKKKLSEIGYILPDHYFRTPGSECQWALLHPCAIKSFDPSPQPAKASAYYEFLSGYITREEWLEELVKTNFFSREDSKSAKQFIRREISKHKYDDNKFRGQNT
jgi:7-cyano-7-deazaguanine synthase in queuosine biosynthesis